MSEKTKRDLRTLFPGVEVPIKGTNETCKVFPVGIIHIEKYAEAISLVMTDVLLAALRVMDEEKKTELDEPIIRKIWPLIAGAALVHLKALIQETIDVDLESIPHWAVAAIVDAWLEENLLKEERFHPWVQVIKKTIVHAFGSERSISETLSKFLSPAATPEKTSSNTDSLDSLIPDGLFGNLDSSLNEPLAPRTSSVPLS